MTERLSSAIDALAGLYPDDGQLLAATMPEELLRRVTWEVRELRAEVTRRVPWEPMGWPTAEQAEAWPAWLILTKDGWVECSVGYTEPGGELFAEIVSGDDWIFITDPEAQFVPLRDGRPVSWAEVEAAVKARKSERENDNG